MVRNEFSFDGVEGEVAFIDGIANADHFVRGDAAAAATGAMYAREGITPDRLNACALSVSSSRVVTVDTGEFCVQHDTSELFYYVRLSAQKTFTLPAAIGGTQSTAVIATVNEATATVGLYVTAPSQAGGVDPPTPANSFLLGYIDVPLSGDPSVRVSANRFNQLRQTAVATGGGGGSGTASNVGTRTIQRNPQANRFAIFNDRQMTRDATKRWRLNADNELLEDELGDYGFIRSSKAAMTFANAANAWAFGSYWDATNGNLWALLFTRDSATAWGCSGHIVESDTGSRVTTEGNSIAVTFPTPAATPIVNIEATPDRAVFLQSGSNAYFVLDANDTGQAAIAGVGVIPAATSLTVVTTVSATALVQHTANVTAPLRFVAAGDQGSVLAEFITAADVAFHAQADNGEIEQWSSTGTKSGTSADAPYGVISGENFDLRTGPGAGQAASTRYAMGPVPNRIQSASTAHTLNVLTGALNQIDGRPTGWLDAYRADETLVLMLVNWSVIGAGAASRGDISFWHASGNSWAQVSPSEPVYSSAGERTLAGAGATATNVGNGIFTLTRIDGVLCYASGEMIIPVRNRDAQSNFWPY